MDAAFSAHHARIGKKKMGVAGDFTTECKVQIPLALSFAKLV